MAAPWILKVLSGTHTGAEIVLSPDETVLGKDEDCDLVIDDVSLSGKHISLRSDDTGMYLTLLDAAKPVYIDGEELAEKSVLLKPFQVITIGTLFLAAGPSDKNWPTIDLSLENKMEPAPGEDNGKEANEDDSSNSRQDGNNTADAGQGPEKADALVQKRRRRGIYLLIALPVTGFFLALAVLFPTDREHHDPDHRTLKPEQIYQITSLADKYGVRIHVDKTTANGDLPKITGYVDTELNRKRFLERLRELDVHAEIGINSSEKAMNAISAILEQFLKNNENSDVRVIAAPDSPGDFVLKGYVEDPEEWSKTVATLKRSARDYHQITSEVQGPQDRIAVLQTMLADVQLKNKLRLLKTQQGIALSGQLDQEQEKRLMQVKEAFVRKFGAQPPVIWDIKSGANTDSQVKLDIRAVSFGENPHIIMKNGERYAIGAQLSSGYTIAGITTVSIILKKGDKTELFYLNPAPR